MNTIYISLPPHIKLFLDWSPLLPCHLLLCSSAPLPPDSCSMLPAHCSLIPAPCPLLSALCSLWLFQSNADILSRLTATLGKSKEVLASEAEKEAEKNNPANFGLNYG